MGQINIEGLGLVELEGDLATEEELSVIQELLDASNKPAPEQPPTVAQQPQEQTAVAPTTPQTADVEKEQPSSFFRKIISPIALGQMNIMESEGRAGKIVTKTAIDTAKSPFELAGATLAATAPETYNALIASPVMQDVDKAIKTITPDLNEQEEIVSTVLGFLGAGKLGADGFKYLVTRFGQSKGKRFARELEKIIDKGSTTAGETAAKVAGATAGIVGYDLAVRKPDDVLLPEIFSAMGEYAKSGDPEKTSVQITKWLDNNIPKEIIEASEKLRINPDDTEAQAKVKQTIDALSFQGAAGGIISAAMLVSKYGLAGARQILSKAGEGVKASGRGIKKAADTLAPEAVKNAVGKINTVSGKFLSTTAGLPKELAEAARRRGSAIQGIEAQVKFDTVQLKRIKNKYNLSNNQINEFLSKGNNLDLPEEAVGVITNLKNTIEKNQSLINKELGLSGDKRIGLQWQDGEVYLTRTYAAASDPLYVKRMTKLIDRYRNTGSTSGANISDDALANMRLSRENYQTIDNAYEYVKRTLTSEKGIVPSDQEIKQTLLNIIERVSPEDKSVIDSLFSSKSINTIISNKVLKGRQDIDESIRSLLGEVTNPLKKVELTLLNQNKLLSEIKFIRDIEKYAVENGNRNIEMGKLIPGIRGEKTGFVIGKDSINNMSKPLSQISDEAIGKFGSGTQLLDNIYTSPTMIKYLQDGLNLANVNKPAGLATKLFSRASSLGQATYTALDTGAYGLQLSGALFQALGNGYLTSMSSPRAFKEAVYLMKEGIVKRDPKAAKLISFLKEQDVISGDPTGRSIVENAKVFAAPPKTWAGKAYDKGFIRNLERLGKLYSQPDNFAKIIAFKAEQANLKSMFPREAESVANYNRRIDLMAAERVRNNMPTYSTAAPISKTIARTPLIGQYPLFFTEMMRTSKNMAKTSFNDLREGLATGNDRQILAGLKRLTTYAGVLAAPKLLSDYTKQEFKIDPKHETYVNSTAPSWYKGGNPIFLEGFVRDETLELDQIENIKKQKAKELRESGQFPKGEGESEKDYIARSLKVSRVVDPRTTEPYIRTRYVFSDTADTFAAVKKPFELLIAKYMNSDTVSDKDLDDTWGLIAESLGGQFVSPRFLTQGLIAAVSGVDPRTGNPIYSDAPGVEASEKIKNSVLAIAETLDPQTRKQTIQLLDSMDSEELLGIARGERANGFPLNSQDIIMSMTTGIKPVTDNVDKKMAYRLGTGIRDLNKIDRDFYKFVSDKTGVGVPLTNEIRDEIVNEYVKSMEQKKKAFQYIDNETQAFVGMPYIRRYYPTEEARKNKNFKEDGAVVDLPYLAKVVTQYGAFDLSQDQAINIANAFTSIEKKRFITESPTDRITQIALQNGFSKNEIKSIVKDLSAIHAYYVKEPLYSEENK